MKTILSRTLCCLGVAALTQTSPVYAKTNALSCKLGLLNDLGWNVHQTTQAPGLNHGNTCESQTAPVFSFNPSIESNTQLLVRVHNALQSNTTRCLVNHQYSAAIKTAIVNITDNKEFKFVSDGQDPRDPFIPPDDNSWTASETRGYDLPSRSLKLGIESLYTKPFIAECATATQIAQLAILKEHYGVFTDAIVNPVEVGIGIWPAYIKAPSIAASKPLLLGSKQRKRALESLATLGKGAFYGQGGYLKPYKGNNYVDSNDNRGQNFVIVEVTENVVESLRARPRPIKELNQLSRKIWKKYRKLQAKGGEKKALSKQMQKELEATAPFFSEVMVYVHPLGVRNFAYHLARQFKWNPRTPYIFELYEDFQSGYFHERYMDYRLKQCQQQAYCRKADRNHYILTSRTGVPEHTVYQSNDACINSLLLNNNY